MSSGEVGFEQQQQEDRRRFLPFRQVVEGPPMMGLTFARDV